MHVLSNILIAKFIYHKKTCQPRKDIHKIANKKLITMYNYIYVILYM